MAKWKDNLIVKLLLGVIVGIIVGLYANEQVIGVINTIKFLIGQVIFFIVPLIILGFITPAITKMKSNASKMLGTMLGLSYSSSVGAALFSMTAGYILIPKLKDRKSTRLNSSHANISYAVFCLTKKTQRYNN